MKYEPNHINDETNHCCCPKCRQSRQKKMTIEKECENLNKKIDSGGLKQDLSRDAEMTRRKKINENKNIWG